MGAVLTTWRYGLMRSFLLAFIIVAAGLAAAHSAAHGQPHPVTHETLVRGIGVDGVQGSVTSSITGRGVQSARITVVLTRAARPGVAGRALQTRVVTLAPPRRAVSVTLSYRCAPSAAPLIYYLSIRSVVVLQNGQRRSVLLRSPGLAKRCA